MRGATAVASSSVIGKREFQSTRPMRGATLGSILAANTQIISIHAPHAGRDGDIYGDKEGLDENFNPRAPCGARQSRRFRYVRDRHFNPRAPCGARPMLRDQYGIYILFQSTRPMRGATSRSGKPLSRPRYFNPRAPCGARRSLAILQGIPPYFNPRAPCGARRTTFAQVALRLQISIHAPHAGRDLPLRRNIVPRGYFNPRAPCGARRSASAC